MNYNISKNKQQKINDIDKAQTAIEQIEPQYQAQMHKAQHIAQSDSDSKDSYANNANHAKSNKKNLTLYVSKGLIKEIDVFLQEYGTAKETRNYFLEESMRFYLAYRKSQLQAELEQKLQKIKAMSK